ncbi:MAG TPA: GNAT family protein [Gaiellaceae bacterium]|nr:GNAT family protein [Gaiellaceae bacterium]
MPRRLRAPDPALADDAIWLEPLAEALVPDLGWVLDGDPDTARFTRIPSSPDGRFLAAWLGRYEHAWDDGTAAGFAVRDAPTGEAVGFAGFVQLDLEKDEGEIGYVVAPAVRGRGIAGRAVALLTRWGFETLRLLRIELRIDPANAYSARIAQRQGYRLEGTLRSLYFKEGLRSDVAVWSRLADDSSRRVGA